MCHTPNNAITMARLRTQPIGSRIQIQAITAAMNGAVLWTTRISATVACCNAMTKESDAAAKQAATASPGRPSALNRFQVLRPSRTTRKRIKVSAAKNPRPATWVQTSASICRAISPPLLQNVAAPRTRIVPLRCASTAPDIHSSPANPRRRLAGEGCGAASGGGSWLICGQPFQKYMERCVFLRTGAVDHIPGAPLFLDRELERLYQPPGREIVRHIGRPRHRDAQPIQCRLQGNGRVLEGQAPPQVGRIDRGRRQPARPVLRRMLDLEQSLAREICRLLQLCRQSGSCDRK